MAPGTLGLYYREKQKLVLLVVEEPTAMSLVSNILVLLRLCAVSGVCTVYCLLKAGFNVGTMNNDNNTIRSFFLKCFLGIINIGFLTNYPLVVQCFPKSGPACPSQGDGFGETRELFSCSASRWQHCSSLIPSLKGRFRAVGRARMNSQSGTRLRGVCMFSLHLLGFSGLLPQSRTMREVSRLVGSEQPPGL